MMKLRSVLDRVEARALSKLEAAAILGVDERTFRRWCRRYEEEGEAGLLDRRLGEGAAKAGAGGGGGAGAGGAGGRGGRGRAALPRAVGGVEREPLPRAPGGRARVRLGLHL